MDKVTQANAGGAEEAASATEELSAQSQTVNTVVGELVEMVGGARARHGVSEYGAVPGAANSMGVRGTSEVNPPSGRIALGEDAQEPGTGNDPGNL